MHLFAGGQRNRFWTYIIFTASYERFNRHGYFVGFGLQLNAMRAEKLQAGSERLQWCRHFADNGSK